MAEETAVPSFDQAFDAAVAQHSEPAVEPVEPATQDEPSETPAEETGAEPALPEESSEEELLSEDEYDALKDNPKALRKALNRAYTQSRQRMKPYENLIKAFEADPDGTLQKLAESRGMSIQRPGQATEPNAQEQTVDLLKRSLGPELEFLADKLAPAFDTLVQRSIDPVRDSVLEQGAIREVDGALANLSAKHTDWKDYEPEMSRLGAIFQPGIGPDGRPTSTQEEYLENLYFLATRTRSNAQQTKKVVQRLQASAKNAENPDSGVASNKVAPRPSGKPTLREAFEAAKAGTRWE